MEAETFGKSINFSPDGELLAVKSGKILEIKNVKDQEVIATHICKGYIGHVEWSPDSQIVLCIEHEESLVEVFWVYESHRHLIINEKAAGLFTACFTPDSSNVLSTLSFGLNVCVYSLYLNTKWYLPGIRHLSNQLPGFAFSPDGKFLVIAERQKDQLTLYSCASWNILQHFQCTDILGISWSPDSVSVAVWSDKTQFRLKIFLLNGRCIYSEDRSNDNAIHNAVWSPSGSILAISLINCKDLKILNCLTWSVIADLEPARALLDAGLNKIIQEVNSPDVKSESNFSNIPAFMFDDSKKFSVRENGCLVFSLCERFLSVADGAAVWLWDCGRLISLIEHQEIVSGLTWDENGYLLSWTENGEMVKWNSSDQKLSRIATAC